MFCEKIRVGNSLFGFSCELLVFWERRIESVIHPFQCANHSYCSFCKEWQEWSALVALFVKSDGSKCRLLQRARRTMEGDSLFCFGQKRVKAWRKEWIWNESLLKRANHSFIKSNLLLSHFNYRRHSLLSLSTKGVMGATGGIRSRHSFCKEQQERIAPIALFKDGSERAKSKSAEEQIPNSGSNVLLASGSLFSVKQIILKIACIWLSIDKGCFNVLFASGSVWDWSLSPEFSGQAVQNTGEELQQGGVCQLYAKTAGSGKYSTSGSDIYPTSGYGKYPTSGSNIYPTSGYGKYPTSGSDIYPTSGSGKYPISGSGK